MGTCNKCGKKINFFSTYKGKDGESYCGDCIKEANKERKENKREVDSCRECGTEIIRKAEVCPNCGVRQIKDIDGIWYLVPIFFSLLGGIIAYGVNQYKDPEKAKNFLWVGIFTTILTWLVWRSFGIWWWWL